MELKSSLLADQVVLITGGTGSFGKQFVETVLRDDLFKLRSLLDQYAADKGKLPQSLDDLVTEHYLREVPKDPITDNKDWNLVTGEDPYSTEGNTGVIDVHSSSPDTSPESPRLVLLDPIHRPGASPCAV